MCTYLTQSAELHGTGYAHGEWIDLRMAVVSFDHPQNVPLDHALCIDFRTDNGDPASHMTVELDAASARRLAETIIAALASPDAAAVATGDAPGINLQ